MKVYRVKDQTVQRFYFGNRAVKVINGCLPSNVPKHILDYLLSIGAVEEETVEDSRSQIKKEEKWQLAH